MNPVSGNTPPNSGVDSARISLSDSVGADPTTMTKTGTFSFNNKTYSVTVTYNKDSLLAKGIDENQIDKKLEDLINEIGMKKLSMLAGYTVGASWPGSQNEVRFGKIGDRHNFQQINDNNMDTIDPDHASAIQKIWKVMARFDWSAKSEPIEEEDEGGLGIELMVEERSDDELIDDGLLEALFNSLPDDNPYRGNSELLSALKDRNEEQILEKINEVDASNEQKNEILNLLTDGEKANRLRGELEPKYSLAATSDYSQTSFGPEGNPGAVACGSICGIAILKLIDKIDDQFNGDFLTDIVLDGITFHNEPSDQSIDRAADFEGEVIEKLKTNRDVNLGHEPVVEERDMFSLEDGKYTVLTCNSSSAGVGHTILLFKGDESYYLFNSLTREGDEEIGINGAHILQFENTSELQIYVENRYPIQDYGSRTAVRVWKIDESTQ